MEGVLGIFQSIISSKTECLDIYLDALDNHQCFQNKSHNEDVVHAINYMLLKPSHRPLGLQLLSRFLGQCSVETLEQKANQWTLLTLKACNVRELALNADRVFELLYKLAQAAQQSTELTKSFANNHLTKIFASLAEVQQTGELAALRCIEVCLRLYPGASGPSRGAVERFLARFIDTPDEELSCNAAKCYHLLQQVRGGGVQGVNHKTQWQNYQLQLVTSLHVVLDEAFAKCTELFEAGPASDAASADKESFGSSLDLSDEPVQRAMQLYIRFRNLVQYLTIALREPFPVTKPIMPKKILNLIGRGLSVTCLLLQQNAISDNLAIGALLPQMHLHLLKLLDALISTLNSHLKGYNDLILSFFLDSLKWTSSKHSAGVTKPFTLLRSKIYDSIALWCLTLHSGSRCETIAEFLIEEVLYDVTPYRSGFTLKVLSGARKHMSKKARRQLHKAQNEQSQLSQAHANDNTIRKENISDQGNQHLCTAALRCLQQMLLASGNLFKPSLIKVIQSEILHISALFHEFPLCNQQLYHQWTCRMEIYNTLNVLLMAPHHLCPPPTQLIFGILQTAQLCDPHEQVRRQCNVVLSSAEKLVHPQKESLVFPIEGREIRNAFIKLKKEHLLNDPSMTWPSTSGNQLHIEESIVDAEIEDDDPATEDDDDIVSITENKQRSATPEIENIVGRRCSEPQILEDQELKAPANSSECRIDNSTNASLSSSRIELKTTDQLKTDPKKENLSSPVPKRLKRQSNAEFPCESQLPKSIKLTKKAALLDDDLLLADIEAAFVDELI